MNKFDIETFDPNKNYAIEASAGTGKTFSIIGIVKEILKKEPNIFDKILIVTYTDKAAGELKDRIKKNVEGIDINDANIYTIHSFCKNTIKEFGVTANLPLNLDLVGDLELSAFTDKYFREGEILKTIIALSELGYEVNIGSLEESFIAGISKYYLDQNNNEDPDIISLKNDEINFDDSLEKIFKFTKAKSLSDLFIDFPEMEMHYNTLKSSELEEAKKMVNQIEQTYNICFPVKFTKGNLKKEPLLSAYNYFVELSASFGGAKSNREKYPLRLLISMYFKDYYIKWQQEKEYNKSQSFDDMIRCIREALKTNDALLDALRNKYKYGIIDEFQDTNQRQFDIFKSIFMCENHRIIVVGDPKQSIYSFQGADVNVYNKAKEEIKNSKEIINGKEENIGILASLGKNWRSSDGAVEFAGKFFSKENGFDFGITDFSPSDCCHDFYSEYDGKPSTSVWVGANSELGGEIDAKKYARIAVEQILDCCQRDINGKTKLQILTRDNKNVSFNDFAILARTRTEMSYIKSEFKKVGIPFIQYKDVTLFKSKECAHWVALLQAIDIPDFTGKNRKIFKKALFTDFFGLDLYEINQSKYDKDDIEEISLFNKWRNLSRNRSWEDLIDSVLTESKLFTVLKELNKSQSINKFKQLSDYIVDYLYDNHSLKDTIDNLNNLSIGNEEDEDGALVGRGTDFDCVKIMTIHASKGLEFPVVISVAGFKGINPKGKAFTYHNEEGKQMLTFDKPKEVSGLINDELIEEFKRIIYVAYTRAKYILMIPNYGENHSKNLKFLQTCTQSFIDNYQSIYRYVFSRNTSTKDLKDATRKIIEQNSDILIDGVTKEEQEKVIKDFIKEEGNRKSYKHSYSSLSHPKEEEEDEDDKEGLKGDGLSEYDLKAIQIVGNYDKGLSPMVIPNNFPKGAKIGTALHEVFEKLDYQQYESMMEDVIKEAFNNQLISLSEIYMNTVKEMVDRVLNSSLPEIKGNKGTNAYFKLNELPLKDKKAEMEFNFNLCINDKDYELLKNYFNGFIDLTFRRGEYYSILDWKSDSLNEDEFLSYNHSHDLKNHVDNAYSIQRVLYAYCLIKWLKIYYKNETEEEIFQNHFSGVYYLFLRGCNKDTSNGVYAQTWNSWEDLKNTFNLIISKKIRRTNG